MLGYPAIAAYVEQAILLSRAHPENLGGRIVDPSTAALLPFPRQFTALLRMIWYHDKDIDTYTTVPRGL